MARAADEAWAALARGGHAALMRHAQTVPGTGDPPGFRLEDCSTQRNLSEAGRAAAARLGGAYRERGVRVARVLSSQWCRCLDTGTALGLARVEAAPEALNSFFDARGEAQRSTAALRALLSALPAEGTVAVLVTHQVNITALTGIFPAMGETLVLRLDAAQGFPVAGRIAGG
ncbi:histidine phosphatase family protein [Salinarimonas soli]|uniref:Histidine phosphatase family protein n=2 Tax=Salinarimonas soli TaxID=1638099 RepID=A0A5B2VCG6_9HYPH|nr:histidine phosphatase family protein [Salinarimonas soli]